MSNNLYLSRTIFLLIWIISVVITVTENLHRPALRLTIGILWRWRPWVTLHGYSALIFTVAVVMSTLVSRLPVTASWQAHGESSCRERATDIPFIGVCFACCWALIPVCGLPYSLETRDFQLLNKGTNTSVTGISKNFLNVQVVSLFNRKTYDEI